MVKLSIKFGQIPKRLFLTGVVCDGWSGYMGHGSYGVIFRGKYNSKLIALKRLRMPQHEAVEDPKKDTQRKVKPLIPFCSASYTPFIRVTNPITASRHCSMKRSSGIIFVILTSSHFTGLMRLRLKDRSAWYRPG